MARKLSNHNLQGSRGFGLIEVLVSLTILTIIMIGLTSLSRMAYYSWENAKNKSIAYNVVQETVEYIRNTRDSSIRSTADWDDGIDKEILNSELLPPPDGFTREITIEDVLSGIEFEGEALSKKKVTVKISWKERLGDRDFTSVTYFTDWRSKY